MCRVELFLKLSMKCVESTNLQNNFCHEKKFFSKTDIKFSNNKAYSLSFYVKIEMKKVKIYQIITKCSPQRPPVSVSNN